MLSLVLRDKLSYLRTNSTILGTNAVRKGISSVHHSEFSALKGQVQLLLINSVFVNKFSQYRQFKPIILNNQWKTEHKVKFMTLKKMAYWESIWRPKNYWRWWKRHKKIHFQMLCRSINRKALALIALETFSFLRILSFCVEWQNLFCSSWKENNNRCGCLWESFWGFSQKHEGVLVKILAKIELKLRKFSKIEDFCIKIHKMLQKNPPTIPNLKWPYLLPPTLLIQFTHPTIP